MTRYSFALIKMTGLSVILFQFLILTACSHIPKSQPQVKNLDDPIINQIYSSAKQVPEEFGGLLDAMLESDVIYLGENHDNTHQHRIQLDIIEALVAKGLQPAIGFEFFSRQQTSHLIRHQNSDDKYHHADAEHSAEKLLRVQLGWAENRDEDWQHLYPILQYAREQKLPVFGADLSPTLRKQLSKGGYAGLNPVEKLLVPESTFSNPDYQEFMYQRFTQAHCGWRDDNYLQNLYATWLARNEAMAESIVTMHRSAPEQPIVMILGAGHTEFNMAVFERTQNLKPDIRQLNLRLQAVAEQPVPATDYFESLKINDQSFGLPFEYFWFTARMPEKEDPCKAFLKYKNKHAKSHKPAG